MTGKRSRPHVWWARRETLLAAGGTALLVWLVAGAWMLLAPGDGVMGPSSPDTSQTVQPSPTVPATSTVSSFDPGTYTGPVNTPTHSAHPHRSPTATPTSSPSHSSAPSPTRQPSQPTSQPSTSGPGHGHGHGHGHGPKP